MPVPPAAAAITTFGYFNRPFFLDFLQQQLITKNDFPITISSRGKKWLCWNGHSTDADSNHLILKPKTR